MEGRSRNDHREIAHRLRNPRVEIQRGTSGQIIWGAVVGTTGARSCSRKKPSDLSLGASCGGERWAATTARGWRKTSSRIRRYVHLEPGQVHSADGLGAIAQSRMARNPPEAVGEGISKFSAADWAQRHTAVSEEDFEREPHRNRFTVLLERTAHLAYRSALTQAGPSGDDAHIAEPGELAPKALVRVDATRKACLTNLDCAQDCLFTEVEHPVHERPICNLVVGRGVQAVVGNH